MGLADVRADIAMMRTPDGHSRVELTRFHTPAAVRAGERDVRGPEGIIIGLAEELG